MWSSEKVLGVFILLATTSYAQVSCPAKASETQTLVGPAGWKSTTAEKQTNLLRASIFNLSPDGREYDLAPSSSLQNKGDKVTQVWDLKEYQTMPVFLRCHYRDTNSVLSISLPKELKTCTLQFRVDAKGNILGQSALTCY